MAHPDLDLARTLADVARGLLRDFPGQQDDRQLQTRYHRLAIALELTLKSYLIVRGHTDEANRRIGHDLRRVAQVATAEGLTVPSALYDLIEDTHPFFMRGGFHREYRTDWQRHRADRAATELDALLTGIAAPIGAR
ncbi:MULTISPECIES: hypothetical protein [unclassified Sphingomonas]|uniref:hypothetical protein n=1 Tax=unclassified Sphingomonas TaxID=196159 RepID=UPI0012E3F791|nr:MULTISPECIES: hypothetical protein [unclassified Sphingomonas]